MFRLNQAAYKRYTTILNISVSNLVTLFRAMPFMLLLTYSTSKDHLLYSLVDRQLVWCCLEGNSVLPGMALEIPVPFHHRSFSLYNLYNSLLDQSTRNKNSAWTPGNAFTVQSHVKAVIWNRCTGLHNYYRTTLVETNPNKSGFPSHFASEMQ